MLKRHVVKIKGPENHPDRELEVTHGGTAAEALAHAMKIDGREGAVGSVEPKDETVGEDGLAKA